MGRLLDSVGGFAKGVGEGAWDGATGMVKGVGALAKGGYDLATSADARKQAWDAAVRDATAAGQFAETAVTDPGKAAQQVGDAVSSTWSKVSTAYQQAAAEGHGAEFIGKAFGQGAVLVGTAFVPGGAEAEAAGALGDAGRVAELAGDAGKAADVAGDAGRLAQVTGDLSKTTKAVGDAAKTNKATESVKDAESVAHMPETGEAAGQGGGTTRVYRVEGQGNERVSIGGNGSVEIPEVRTSKRRGPERNLYLNFGDEARAQQFLQQRLQQFPDSAIKSFDVPTSFVDELRANAIPETERSLKPNSPVIADPTKAADQFGLPGHWIEQLRSDVIQGSGKVHPKE